MTDACIEIGDFAQSEVNAESDRDMIRATFLCLTLLLCLLLGLGILETWKQHPVLPVPVREFVVEATETLRAMLSIKDTAGATAATTGAASAENDDDKDDGKEAVEPASDAASDKKAEHSVQSRPENDRPPGLVINTLSGSPGAPIWARIAKGSNRSARSKASDASAVGTVRESRVTSTHPFLDLENEAVSGRLRIRETPASIPSFDIMGDQRLSQPPGINVLNSPRMPALIAEIASRLEAEAQPKRQGSAVAGFSDDDLALPSAKKTDREHSTAETDVPLLVATEPSVNRQAPVPSKAVPSKAVPSKAVPPTSATSEVTPPPAPSDLDPEIVPVPSLARARSRTRIPLQDLKTVPDPAPVPDQSQTSSTSPSRVTPVPDAEPTSPAPKVVPKRILRAEPPLRITRQMAHLRPRIDSVLRFYFDKPLNTKDDSAWSIMHSILGYGVNAPLAVGGERGRRTNAVGWMCWNNPCAGDQLLYLQDGYIAGREGPGFQGHPGQFLAMLAQVRLRQDYPMRIQGKEFRVEDLIEAEKRTCRADKELTFKLIALSHYLDTDAEWLDERGQKWNIPKMLQIEMAQPINGAACGGTHRVMACSYALLKREQRGEPLFGPYIAAKRYMRSFQLKALGLQNRDGSFSSDWFKRRADWGDMDRKLQTTGHILEWLVFTLPRNELSNPGIVRATKFLTDSMTKHRYHDWEVGPRGHALRALTLFQQRVFQSSQPLARTNADQAR